MRGAFLEALAWDEAAAPIGDGRIVLVPVGAAAKEHGLHLPMDTDRRIARELARRVALELPVLVAPAVDFGYYPAFVDYPGSQHLRAETFAALMRDLLEGFVRQGARRLAIVNTGVSTEAPLRLAMREVEERTGVRVVCADLRELGRAARGVLERPDGGHADEAETSLMLAIAPEAVRLERARPEAEEGGGGVFQAPAKLATATGATGDPTRASAAKGEALLAAMTRDLVEGLRAAFPEAV
jgi:creatinine amidohydrolase